jgi:LysR family hydrogen peroxide-inducible transcriptional activator
MELQQIRYFLAVARELNFRRAARTCNVAQPSVTNAIKALERELGGELFCRQRPIRLSALGEAVLPHLARIAQEVENARETAKAFTTPASAAPAVAPCGPTSASACG